MVSLAGQGEEDIAKSRHQADVPWPRTAKRPVLVHLARYSYQRQVRYSLAAVALVDAEAGPQSISVLSQIPPPRSSGFFPLP
jgi:hypothetical protein